jgi:hypothetical protein
MVVTARADFDRRNPFRPPHLRFVVKILSSSAVAAVRHLGFQIFIAVDADISNAKLPHREIVSEWVSGHPGKEEEAYVVAS